MKTGFLIAGFLCVTTLLLITTVSAISVTAQSAWSEKSSLRNAKAGLGVAIVNGNIYAIGGANNLTATTDVYALPIATPDPEFSTELTFTLFAAATLTMAVFARKIRKRDHY